MVWTVLVKLKAGTRNNRTLSASWLSVSGDVGVLASTNVLLCRGTTTFLPAKTASTNGRLQAANLCSIPSTLSPKPVLSTASVLPTASFLRTSSFLSFASITVLPSTVLPTASTTLSSSSPTSPTTVVTPSSATPLSPSPTRSSLTSWSSSN